MNRKYFGTPPYQKYVLVRSSERQLFVRLRTAFSANGGDRLIAEPKEHISAPERD
jgi:hypothetical protein